MMKARIAAVLVLCIARPSAAQRAPDFAAFDKYVEQSVRDWKGVGLGMGITVAAVVVICRGDRSCQLGD